MWHKIKVFKHTINSLYYNIKGNITNKPGKTDYEANSWCKYRKSSESL